MNFVEAILVLTASNVLLALICVMVPIVYQDLTGRKIDEDAAQIVDKFKIPHD